MEGKKYGKLTVIKDTGKRNKHKGIIYLCKCDCGKETEAVGSYMRRGDKKSCGCLKAGAKKVHGASKTKLYRIWADMLQRCKNKNCNNYKYYGARGVSVTKDWENFVNFRDWALSNGYKKGLSIDRVNTRGNYEPSNCRWATREMQDNNRTDNTIIEVRGERLTLSQVSKKYELHPGTLSERHKAGDKGEDLIRKPRRGVKVTGKKKQRKFVSLDSLKVGEAKWLLSNTEMYQREIAKKCGMSQVYVSRIKLGKAHADVKAVKPKWWGVENQKEE